MERLLQPMTHEIREQIKLRQKKKQDIADLIRDKDISNEDLSYCYISDLQLQTCSISNVNFTATKMKFQFQKGSARNCRFIHTHFLDGSSLRSADMKTCNLNGAYAPNIDIAYADMRQCNVCDTTFTMFSKKAYKIKLDKHFLKLFLRFVEIDGVNLDDHL